MELGCKDRDSLNNEYPKSMPNAYFFHFLRGYIDGDGSIYISKSEKSRQKNVLRVSMLGSKDFLNIITKKMNKILNIKINNLIGKIKRTKVPLYRVTFNGELARKLCHKMYADCGDLYLKRKKERFNIHLMNRMKNAKASYIG